MWLDFMPENIGSAVQRFSYMAVFGEKRCVHTYMERWRENSSPVLRYVRTLRDIRKPVYIRFCNRLNTEKAPYTPSGSIRDLVTIFQIVLVLVRNHTLAETAAL